MYLNQNARIQTGSSRIQTIPVHVYEQCEFLYTCNIARIQTSDYTYTHIITRRRTIDLHVYEHRDVRIRIFYKFIYEQIWRRQTLLYVYEPYSRINNSHVRIHTMFTYTNNNSYVRIRTMFTYTNKSHVRTRTMFTFTNNVCVRIRTIFHVYKQFKCSYTNYFHVYEQCVCAYTNYFHVYEQCTCTYTNYSHVYK